MVPQLQREFGGCAGNIAYNLHLLGEKPVPMATVGHDFSQYSQHFSALGIDQSCIRWIPDVYTAQAFITTDEDHNQIAAFHPGAMLYSDLTHVTDAQQITIGLVGPYSLAGILQHADEFAQAKIPFIFDPGQGLLLFDCNQLRSVINLATYVIVNAYEAKLLQHRTNWSVQTLAQRTSVYIVTDGAAGAHIHTPQNCYSVPAAQAKQVVDPTGCGDAFRAGWIFGLTQTDDWPTIGRIRNLMGAIALAHGGTQNHQLDRESFHRQFV